MNKIQENTLTAGFEWIDGIPEGWQRRIIKRDFEVVLGKMLQSNQTNEAETEESYLRSANIKWEGVDTSDIKTMWFSPEEKERLRLKYGDLLVSEGGDAGRTSIWRNELETCYIQNAINRIRAQQDDSTSYLFYWLYLLKSIGCIDAVVSRITIAHLTAEKLARIVFLKPPKIEQDRIAAYLDKTCAAIDTAIDKKQKQLETLDALRKSIIHKAVTRGLDDSGELKDSGVEWIERVPIKWQSFRIKDVAQLSPRFSNGKPGLKELCAIIPMEAVSEQGKIDISSIEEFDFITTGLTNFEVGDVIFAKITPCMENGKGAYVKALPTRYAFGSTEFHVLRPGFRVNGKFLYYYTYNSFFRDYAEVNMTGAAGQKRVSSRFLNYSRIYLPSISEQKQIVEYLDSKIDMLHVLQENLSNQIFALEQYRKSLIHECVTGKRRITEGDMQRVQQY